MKALQTRDQTVGHVTEAGTVPRSALIYDQEELDVFCYYERLELKREISQQRDMITSVETLVSSSSGRLLDIGGTYLVSVFER